MAHFKIDSILYCKYKEMETECCINYLVSAINLKGGM